MSNELQVTNEADISIEAKAEINEDIDRIITAHKNNRQAINKLVFASVAAMTEADDAQAELANKGWFKRRLGSITGSNSSLQDRINSNRATAMYASQQTLQKLAEQNLMTFDLIAAVNNKLNASLTKVDEEFANIYKGLAKFLKTNRSELARLESRLEKVERNVNLLNWNNSIEYQEFNGVEYAELDDVSKIVCLVRDFYDITKGEWSNSDLLLLKSAMKDIDISPKDNINYFDVLKGISNNEKLKEYLLDGRTIAVIDDPSYLLSLGCLKKYEMLNNEESYMVETLVEHMNSMGVSVKRNIVCEQLTAKYLAGKAFVDINVNVECYDLILDLLYNIRQAKDEQLLIGNEAVDGAEKECDSKQEENVETVGLNKQEENVEEKQLEDDTGKEYYGINVPITITMAIDSSNNIVAAGTVQTYENTKVLLTDQLRVDGKVIFKNCEIVFDYAGNIALLSSKSNSEIYFEDCEFNVKKKTKLSIMSLKGICNFKNCLFSGLNYGYGKLKADWDYDVRSYERNRAFIDLWDKSDEKIVLTFDDCAFEDNEGTFLSLDGWNNRGKNLKVNILNCYVKNHTGNFVCAREVYVGNDAGINIEETYFEDVNAYTQADDWDFRTQNYMALIYVEDSKLMCNECEFHDVKESVFGMKAFYTREDLGTTIENCLFKECKQDELVYGTVKNCEFEDMSVDGMQYGDTRDGENTNAIVTDTKFDNCNGRIRITCGKLENCTFEDSTIRIEVVGKPNTKYAYDSVTNNLIFSNCTALEVPSYSLNNTTCFLQALSYLDEDGICVYFNDCKFKNCYTRNQYVNTSAKALGWFDRVKTIYVGSERGTIVE